MPAAKSKATKTKVTRTKASKAAAPAKSKPKVKAPAPKPKVKAKAPKATAPAKAKAKAPAPKPSAPKKAPPRLKLVPKAAPKTVPKTTSARPVAARPASASSQVTALGFAPYQEKKGEAYMNEKQTEHFRRVLHAWKRQLMEEVDRTVHHMQDEAANYPDPNDRASQEEEITLELRARDRERKLIKKIDEALASLDQGEYGYCDICGVEIGIRRLEARPTATQCIDCKILEEIREKQMA
ncbi:MAG: RNA polymerase-binding protein DksA [Gammaproteobacteria bacterium]|nr:RNA polymerase-binding protein DksA [Gammaproteobacteria bacterium]